jgi:phage terminase large subunit-like protein
MRRLPPIDRAAVERSLPRLNEAERRQLLADLELRDRLLAGRSFHYLYPDADSVWDGPKTGVFETGRGQAIYARDRYAKHLEFFAAGAKYRERALMAGNRTGKTVCGAYEDTCHATGLYPTWWPGRRFDRPTDGWIAGKTNETTRDILQKRLFGEGVAWVRGEKRLPGTGMVPGELIGDITWKSGVSDLVDTVLVKHVPTGAWSRIGLKSYEQGRSAFEGTEKDWIHVDEEPEPEVYDEGLVRTMTTDGLIYATFTPLKGLSKVALGFMPQEYRPDE